MKDPWFDLRRFTQARIAQGCKTACKTFQDSGEKSVEKFPPQVVQCPVFCRRILECYKWTLLPKSDGVI